MTNDPTQLKIEQILGEFNFKRVQRIMAELSWKWASSKAEHGVPEINELVTAASELLHDLVKAKADVLEIGTGGFDAYRGKDGEHEYLGLRFVLEDVMA